MARKVLKKVVVYSTPHLFCFYFFLVRQLKLNLFQRTFLAIKDSTYYARFGFKYVNIQTQISRHGPGSRDTRGHRAAQRPAEGQGVHIRNCR